MVVLVILMGLCVVPSLYAWFNVFSNWDPYGQSATSRIRVAIADVDRGADLFGLQLEVGEQLVVEELRIQEGQLAVAQVGSFAVAEPPQLGEATGSAITFLDATDIRPVECLRQLG